MIVTMTAYFEDGSSTVVTFEKPPGYHPESAYVGLCGAKAAYDKVKKTVVKTARTRTVTDRKSNAPVFLDSVAWEGKYPAD